jgi:hypothetical protein
MLIPALMGQPNGPREVRSRMIGSRWRTTPRPIRPGCRYLGVPLMATNKPRKCSPLQIKISRPKGRPASGPDIYLGGDMRQVSIIESPDSSYRYAAVDRQTGAVLLRFSDPAALAALCHRLEWVVHEGPSSKGSAGADSEERSQRGRHRGRVGGYTSYTGARRRRLTRVGL